MAKHEAEICMHDLEMYVEALVVLRQHVFQWAAWLPTAKFTFTFGNCPYTAEARWNDGGVPEGHQCPYLCSRTSPQECQRENLLGRASEGAHRAVASRGLPPTFSGTTSDPRWGLVVPGGVESVVLDVFKAAALFRLFTQSLFQSATISVIVVLLEVG